MCSVIGGLSESIESQLSKQPPGKLGLIMRETTTSTVIWLTAPLGVSRYLLCMKFVVGRARTSIVRHLWLSLLRMSLSARSVLFSVDPFCRSHCLCDELLYCFGIFVGFRYHLSMAGSF